MIIHMYIYIYTHTYFCVLANQFVSGQRKDLDDYEAFFRATESSGPKVYDAIDDSLMEESPPESQGLLVVVGILEPLGENCINKSWRGKLKKDLWRLEFFFWNYVWLMSVSNFSRMLVQSFEYHSHSDGMLTVF